MTSYVTTLEIPRLKGIKYVCLIYEWSCEISIPVVYLFALLCADDHSVLNVCHSNTVATSVCDPIITCLRVAHNIIVHFSFSAFHQKWNQRIAISNIRSPPMHPILLLWLFHAWYIKWMDPCLTSSLVQPVQLLSGLCAATTCGNGVESLNMLRAKVASRSWPYVFKWFSCNANVP